MSQIFRPSVLISDKGTNIALRHVESIRRVSKDEDVVIDRLKNDLTFIIITGSGFEHTISVNQLIKTFPKELSENAAVHDVYQAVLDRWIYLLG